MWDVLLAYNWRIFGIQGICFRSGIPDSYRVCWRPCIAVGVACCLLCQFLQHIKCIKHQLCHIDSAGTNSDYKGNNLLLRNGHAFTYLPNLLDQVFTHRNCFAPCNVAFIIPANTGHPVAHCLTEITRTYLLNGSGQ